MSSAVVRAGICENSEYAASVSGIWPIAVSSPAFARQAGRERNMSMTDPIADLLTRIRNASNAGHKMVDIPASTLKTSIARVFYNRGFIRGFRRIENGQQGILRVYLAYRNGKSLIVGIKRISKPGCRVYAGVSEIPRVMGGRGMAVLTTPKGVVTDMEARRENVGGEVLLHVW